jgi:hypothetical protein
VVVGGVVVAGGFVAGGLVGGALVAGGVVAALPSPAPIPLELDGPFVPEGEDPEAGALPAVVEGEGAVVGGVVEVDADPAATACVPSGWIRNQVLSSPSPVAVEGEWSPA